ncbi:HET-domain-containing protein [Aspergillus piperis CBS 112811]|uniref:HET-domain-containing protein n=1 Tax=Aspergillus piperis CBS 112811 TaxID=1448313 RepID=A0A8G1VK17_9EURO|nr:HET-domain-containing protein [Aspergillus piperis CBS 112811]RAH53288.1 HET-domain-containing protein [Aspergillus piperis CBS 112811]
MALQDAGRAGCTFCKTIWAHHCHFWSRKSYSDVFSANFFACHEWDTCACRIYKGPLHFVIHKFINEWPSNSPRLLILGMANSEKSEIPDLIYSRSRVIAEFEIRIAKSAEIPEEDTHLIECLVRNALPFDLGSKRCLSLAAKWLRNCHKKHMQCDMLEDRPPFFPTRVIDVGKPNRRPHLHVSRIGETAKWMALSYCWGGDSRFTLNSSSFDDLRSGWSLAGFPATLRDAVLVTRALGIRYLWVDSLCIFQDDPSDWEAEASKMSSVYKHAAVTIAATSARTAEDGFLDKRAPYFSSHFPWRRQCHQGSGSVQHVSRVDPVVFQSHRQFYHQEPLRHSRWATRGWTLQEELLSKRLLYYTEEEMIWRCYAGKAREPAQKVNDGEDVYPEPLWFTLDEPDGNYAPQPAYESWIRLLEDYAARSLSFDKDRLPAIGALAESFHAHMKEQYCAGLWRGDILFGLLWSIQRCHGTEISAPTSVSSKERRPSWSWVGADGCAKLKWPTPDFRYCMTYLAIVAHCQIYRKSHDIFGRIEGAELVLNAPYRHVCLRPGSYSKSRWNPVSLAQRMLTQLGPLASTKELAQIALGRPEYLESTETSGSVTVLSSSTEFTLIQIAKADHWYTPTLYLLILQPLTRQVAQSEEMRRYRRAGLLRLCSKRGGLQSDDFRAAESVEGTLTERLEDAAYWEVIREEWPVGSFLIE